MQGGSLDSLIARTATNWFDFVDRSSEARELMPYIDAAGSWMSAAPLPRDAKANKWKNGFHGLEHALVMYLHGHWRRGSEAALHFAPELGKKNMSATPYWFEASETSRVSLGDVELDGSKHSIVRVTYSGLW